MRRFEALSGRHLADLGGPCRGCAEWQLEPTAAGRAPRDESSVLAVKRAWLSTVRTEHGGAGWVVIVDDEIAGHIVYAPAAAVPRAEAFPTSPPSGDALVVAGFWAAAPSLYKPLVQRAVKDCRARGVAALEAFGGRDVPAGCLTRTGRGGLPCRLPPALLERVGFRVVREHPTSPRYRLDAGSALPVLDHLEAGVGELARALAPGRRAAPGLHRDADAR